MPRYPLFLNLIIFFLIPFTGFTQTVLNADNVLNNTYELINSKLAPGYTAVEAPDQTGTNVDGTHPSFGRHIAEVFDTDLNKNVFEFYSHVAEDNDVTGGLVRQRVEMKTYAASPDNLKGVIGETVTYKWRFKIPIGFQPSTNFTHIHQVKAVDGDDSSPLFTLTPRKGSPNTLQLIYVVDDNGSNDYKAEANLSLFEGNWVEALETIKIGTGSAGAYSMVIKKVSNGTVLLSYSSSAIQTIRTAATDPALTGKVANSFIRPKWGIYRSLESSNYLRDESLRISDVLIAEGTDSQQSRDQNITFNALPSKLYGDSNFDIAASASSSLSLGYSSSNLAVATIVNNQIHITGLGSTTITATQSGNTSYNWASRSQVLTVASGKQIVTLSLPLKYTNSADFDPGASSSIGSPIVYSSSNLAVATIVNNKIHIVAKGTSTITASAVGNSNYDAATDVQQLIVQCSCVQ